MASESSTRVRSMPFGKYNAFPDWFNFSPKGYPPFKRTWPNKGRVEKTPVWLSTDLRDGNQALANPMDFNKKLAFFRELVKIGFKEIEVAFPSASQVDFDFCRYIIENDIVPPDVTLQVCLLPHEHLIRRTFEALKGARRAIVHFLVTQDTQRRRISGMTRKEQHELAVQNCVLMRDIANEMVGVVPSELQFQVSLEYFVGSELDHAMDITNSCLGVLGASREHPVIINLAATVELSTPNLFADQIEWMHNNFKDRSSVILSLHCHNDRGTAVAAVELGLMAGAERVEGCLFGGGERAGNVCLVTLAMNMLTQGMDPKLNLSDMDSLIRIVEHCNEIPVAFRQPYAGAGIHTAFSGIHQHWIKMGIEVQEKSGPDAKFDIPFLSCDPRDIGRTLDNVIRVNSQSGKAGTSVCIENSLGIGIGGMPANMQKEWLRRVQIVCDDSGKELQDDEMVQLFEETYFRYDFLKLDRFDFAENGLVVTMTFNKKKQTWTGSGEGMNHIDAFISLIEQNVGPHVPLLKSLSLKWTASVPSRKMQGKLVTFSEITAGQTSSFGVGVSADKTRSAFESVCSAISRAVAAQRNECVQSAQSEGVQCNQRAQRDHQPPFHPAVASSRL